MKPLSRPTALAAGRTLLAAVALSVIVACGGGAGADGDTNESPYDGPVSADTAVEVASSFDPGEPDAVIALNDVVAAGSDDAVPDLLGLLEDEDANRQWAGLYMALLLTDNEEEVELVRPLLAHGEPVYRTMAAGTLAGLGEADALAVLVDALSSESDLPFSDPPRRLASYAVAALEELTGESFDDAAGWESWWRDVEGAIAWDGERYVVR